MKTAPLIVKMIALPFVGGFLFICTAVALPFMFWAEVSEKFFGEADE